MYVEIVPNHGSDKKTVLIRESYWENGRSHKRTVANITKLPKELIPLIKCLLKDENAKIVPKGPQSIMEVRRTLSHGHVAAVKGIMDNLDISEMIGDQKSKYHSICLAMIASRIADPQAHYFSCDGWQCDQKDLENKHNDPNHNLPTSTLGLEFGVTESKEEDLYSAMDWLLEKQDETQKNLAKKHLSEGAIVLYDLHSVQIEATTDPHVPGKKKEKKKNLEMKFGLLTTGDGCPVAVEAFKGNLADLSTVSHQIDKLRHKFGLKKFVFIDDRGMVTQMDINKDIKSFGMDWISVLKKSSLKKIMKTKDQIIQTSLFDAHNICEVESDEYPGMRLIICHNTSREMMRRRKREKDLNRAEKDLLGVQEATQREKYTLKGSRKIEERVGRVLDKYRVKPFFDIEIKDDSLTYSRNQEAICEENNIDGLYVMATSLSKEDMSPKKVISSYKHLARMERAFRSLKEEDIKARSVKPEEMMKAHMFLCVLAYYVEWHMRKALKTLLLDDEEIFPEYSVTSKKKSPSAKGKRKANLRCNSAGFPFLTFPSLISELSTISMCWMKFANKDSLVPSIASPTSLQKEIFKQLKVQLESKS
ncbi:MAG: IS1634 family transposase [Proteobacteria bacterium]|nr:IS1634 family transposase [Pseudomonadota bacterium]